MAEELVLLAAKFTRFGERVKVALAGKGINYELVEEDLYNKSPLLLQMNPVHKQVPVLIHNGNPICESMVIIEYIDEVLNHKAPLLLPSDPYKRAQARFWVDYIEKKIYPNAKMIWVTEGEGKETYKKKLIESYRTLEKELGEKPYFGGENLGYVDVALIPFYSMFYSFEKLGKFSMALECPKIAEWATRCLEKESVSKSIADSYEYYEAVLEIINKRKL